MACSGTTVMRMPAMNKITQMTNILTMRTMRTICIQTTNTMRRNSTPITNITKNHSSQTTNITRRHTIQMTNIMRMIRIQTTSITRGTTRDIDKNRAAVRTDASPCCSASQNPILLLDFVFNIFMFPSISPSSFKTSSAVSN